MKEFNEIRITAFTLLGLVLMLFFGACKKSIVIEPDPPFPTYETQAGTFEMEDDCVNGPYLLNLENVPQQDTRLLISNFRDDPNVRINAYVQGSDIIIPKQFVNLDGLTFNISGMATKTGQKLDLFYNIRSANQNKGYDCQARGFEI